MAKLQAKSLATLPVNGSWRQEILSCLVESYDCVEQLARELSDLHEQLSPVLPGAPFQGSALTPVSVPHLLRCAPPPRRADGDQVTG
jgi:hypothetical protein